MIGYKIITERNPGVKLSAFFKIGPYRATYEEGKRTFAPVVHGIKTMLFVYKDRRVAESHYRRTEMEAGKKFLWEVELEEPVIRPDFMLDPGFFDGTYKSFFMISSTSSGEISSSSDDRWNLAEEELKKFWSLVRKRSTMTRAAGLLGNKVMIPPRGTFVTPSVLMVRRIEGVKPYEYRRRK
jgi:hypothetical protein